MARAKVELRDSLSYTAKGITFKRGVPVIITNPDIIEYFKNSSGFSVTMLDASPPRKKAAPAPAPAAPAPSKGSKGDDEEEAPKKTSPKVKTTKRTKSK